MSLDEFIKKQGIAEEFKGLVEEAKNDPYNPGLYEKTESLVAQETGQAPFRDVNGNPIEPSPSALREALQIQYKISKQRALEYAESNQASILNSIPQNKLSAILYKTTPNKKTGKKSHDDIASLHEEVIGLSEIEKIILSNKSEPEQKERALSAMYKNVPQYIISRLKKTGKLSDKEIKLWMPFLIKMSKINQGYALRLNKEVIEEKAKIMQEKLADKSHITGYLEENLKSYKPEEKEAFWDTTYSYAA